MCSRTEHMCRTRKQSDRLSARSPPDEPRLRVRSRGPADRMATTLKRMGSISYQHIFSSDAIGTLRGMARDNSNDFYSNPESWPLIATHHNDFKEIYFNGSLSIHHGRQEFKARRRIRCDISARKLQLRDTRLRRPLTILNVLSIWGYWTLARQPLPLPAPVQTSNNRLMFRI